MLFTSIAFIFKSFKFFSNRGDTATDKTRGLQPAGGMQFEANDFQDAGCDSAVEKLPDKDYFRTHNASSGIRLY